VPALSKVLRVLLEGILDYAGTFPPASLPLADAVANYASARTGNESWILGRLVVPAASLPDLEKVAAEKGVRPLFISVTLGAQPEKQLDEVLAFNQRMNTRAQVVSVEFPTLGSSDIPNLDGRLPDTLDAFFETPIDADLESRIAAIATIGASAKIRTGGVTPGAVPTPHGIVRFLNCCANAKTAFKATAGLHHLIRGCYPLTYEANSPTETMHGFLNLAIAAALTRTKADAAAVVEALVEPSADAFQFAADAVGWRNRTINLKDLAATRRHFFRSFGSCSIREPIDELARMRLL
jgi:hypothetical protein